LNVSRSVLDLDYAATEKEILEFIRRIVKDAEVEGVVVGLSGGVDSAVVGALCLKALGKERLVTLLMPSDFTPAVDIEDADGLAKQWGTKTLRVNISKIADQFYAGLGIEGSKIARANVHARVRMAFCYYAANGMNLLVAGTGDRSESEIGYFTKFGDGGVDFLPIAHLYKTQVRALGAHLGLPKRIVDKPASPQLWPGHKVSEELPADYDKLDAVLYCLFDEKMQPVKASREAGVPLAVVQRVLEMHRRSAHKRLLPLMVGPK